MAGSPVRLTPVAWTDLHALLEREPESLFAVLDSCDAPQVTAQAHALGAERAVSLYRGAAEREFAAVAPYLLAVDAKVLDWIAATLAETPWGILAVAPVTLDVLRRHFRRFLRVRGPRDESWYFRFYDPRVLPPFLESCTVDEVEQLFGPVRQFVVPGQDGVRLMSLEPAAARRSANAPAARGRGPAVVTVSALQPLRIRSEQLQALEPASREQFVRRAVAHLEEFFGEQLELLGPAHTRTLVEYGMKRCDRRGIESERDVLLWLTLMVVLGSDFDTDPQYPWVETSWGRLADADISARVDVVFDKAMRYADLVFGKQGEHLRSALERLDGMALTDLGDALAGDLLGRAEGLARRLWPEKAQRIPPQALRQLAKQASLMARQWHMDTPEGRALFFGLVLVLGSGVDHDPQFPWVAAVVQDAAAEPGPQRVERLGDRTRTELRAWLAPAH